MLYYYYYTCRQLMCNFSRFFSTLAAVQMEGVELTGKLYHAFLWEGVNHPQGRVWKTIKDHCPSARVGGTSNESRWWNNCNSVTCSAYVSISLTTIVCSRLILGWTFRGSKYCQLILAENRWKQFQWAIENLHEVLTDGFDDVIWTDGYSCGQ